MLTPTIVKHWSDTKTINVIGYFGGNAGDVFLQDEDGAGSGTRIKEWPTVVKSNQQPMILLSVPGVYELLAPTPNNFNEYIQFFHNRDVTGNDNAYILLRTLNGNIVVDTQDLSHTRIYFYAIFERK